MHSNSAQNNTHRQLLVKCTVTNPHGITSERFVDQAEFSLWQYLLEEKHGLTIHDPMPCLWIPRQESRRHDKLFSHAAYQASVLKLTYKKFDAASGVTETKVRYVLAEEYDQVSELLANHLGVDTEANQEVIVDVQAGEAVSTSPAKRWFRARPAATYCAA